MTTRDSGPLRMRWRSLAALCLASAVGVVAYGWPFLAPVGSQLNGHAADAPYVFLILLPLVVLVVLAELAEGGMDAKAVALLGVLAAVGTALRALSPGTGGFEPTLFVVILAGWVFGAGFGFALGALVIVASALVTGGVGPWMPFQMLGLAWVGVFAGLLPGRVRGGPAGSAGSAGPNPPARLGDRLVLPIYAAAASFGYGAVLNLSGWPFSRELPPAMAYDPAASALENLHHQWVFYLATSLGWDLVRACVNCLLVVLVSRPVLAALRRAADRAAFDAPVSFAPGSSEAQVVGSTPEPSAGSSATSSTSNPSVSSR